MTIDLKKALEQGGDPSRSPETDGIFRVEMFIEMSSDRTNDHEDMDGGYLNYFVWLSGGAILASIGFIYRRLRAK